MSDKDITISGFLLLYGGITLTTFTLGGLITGKFRRWFHSLSKITFNFRLPNKCVYIQYNDSRNGYTDFILETDTPSTELKLIQTSPIQYLKTKVYYNMVGSIKILKIGKKGKDINVDFDFVFRIARFLGLDTENQNKDDLVLMITNHINYNPDKHHTNLGYLETKTHFGSLEDQ